MFTLVHKLSTFIAELKVVHPGGMARSARSSSTTTFTSHTFCTYLLWKPNVYL